MRELKPMEVDLARIVLVGTVLFAIAAVVLLAMHTSLTNSGHGRWPWIAVSGVGLGLFGFYYIVRRDRAIARDATASRTTDGPSAG
jgi:Kef-type K+ transport system membrane component KefB